MSVKSHLTYGASVRPENAVTYSAGNEGQKICGVFSETAPLQRSSTPSVVRPCVQSAIFPCVFSCTRMRISRVYTRMIHRRGFSTLVLFILFCSRVKFHVNLLYWAVCVCVCVCVCVFGLGEERGRNCRGGGFVCAECRVGNGFCQLHPGAPQRNAGPNQRHRPALTLPSMWKCQYMAFFVVVVIGILVCNYN